MKIDWQIVKKVSLIFLAVIGISAVWTVLAVTVPWVIIGAFIIGFPIALYVMFYKDQKWHEEFDARQERERAEYEKEQAEKDAEWERQRAESDRKWAEHDAKMKRQWDEHDERRRKN